MTAALSARGLSKRYGRTTALDAVELEVAAGELVGLLGPNGAGKSTLVKIACGLVRPTAGEVDVDGAMAGSRAARASTGYQNGLHALTSDIDGAAGVIVQLGPFGGASDVSAAIWPWAVAWSTAVLALVALAFRRRDL